MLELFTHTCPGPPPGACSVRAAEDFEPVIVPPVIVPAAGAMVVAGAAAGAAGAAAGAAALLADLLMPPCPLQAPRPPCGEVVPSLQVTGPLPEDEAEDEDVVAAGAAAAGAAEPAPVEADLFTPPCPLQAPRPP